MPIPHRSDVRARMKEALQTVATAAGVPETSRTTLLALSELARRAGGDGLNIATPDLAPYELRVFSQNGEDGVIAEILRRTGTATKHFVEFGASTGAENNCALLADVFGWAGLFMEGGDYEAAILDRKYRSNRRVTTRQALVFPDNVEQLFREAGVPEDLDVLSVDIDGGDYYIWEALESYRPRLVVIEYNSLLDPTKRLVQPRDAGPWDHTDYYGASLGALRALADQKGYRLVYTELTGNNAFFVRTDLPGAWPEPDEVPERSSNYWLQGVAHPPDAGGRAFTDLDD